MTTRQDVIDLLGVRVADTHVHSLEWGDIQRDANNVTITAVTLMRQTAEPIPCLYLRPSHGRVRGGVVAIHQHNNEYHLGKSEPSGLSGDPRMNYGYAMAARGFAVLAPDLVGFEDRRGIFGSDAAFEQFTALNLIASGRCLAALNVEDVMTAVSWLVEQAPNAGSIGIYGHSMGGQVAVYAAACDPRVRAAVVSCGLSTIESSRRMHVLHNPAWYVPSLKSFGDITAIASATAGQHFAVIAGSADEYFPLDGVHAAFEGFAYGSASLQTFDGPHELPTNLLNDSCDWLASALGGLSTV